MMNIEKEKLFKYCEQQLNRNITKNEAVEVWHNYTYTGCLEVDIEDAFKRTFFN